VPLVAQELLSVYNTSTLLALLRVLLHLVDASPRAAHTEALLKANGVSILVQLLAKTLQGLAAWAGKRITLYGPGGGGPGLALIADDTEDRLGAFASKLAGRGDASGAAVEASSGAGSGAGASGAAVGGTTVLPPQLLHDMCVGAVSMVRLDIFVPPSGVDRRMAGSARRGAAHMQQAGAAHMQQASAGSAAGANDGPVQQDVALACLELLVGLTGTLEAPAATEAFAACGGLVLCQRLVMMTANLAGGGAAGGEGSPAFGGTLQKPSALQMAAASLAAGCITNVACGSEAGLEAAVKLWGGIGPLQDLTSPGIGCREIALMALAVRMAETARTQTALQDTTSFVE
jgi:hypothetical protein